MKELLETYSKTYYDGHPIITNEQYDRLEQMYGQTLQGNGDTPHAFQMYSLQKSYNIHSAPTQEQPLSGFVRTEKLDGAAISLLYIAGKLQLALTRGDGKRGRDITEKALLLDSIPSVIEVDGLVQITGEICAISSVPNSRNFASGALNQKDLKVFQDKIVEGRLVFVAYAVQNRPDFYGINNTYTSDMKYLGVWFKTVLNFDCSEYPTDGEVYRLDNNEAFTKLGHTSKFPRGAFALKENDEGVVTKLLDVIWQTGKSGKVTPVAILETAQISGANVSRATLNNMAFIEAMDLEIGCNVRVVRSGEIIPCVVERVE